MASPVDSTRIFVIKIVGEVSLFFLKLLKSRSLKNACFAELMSARYVDTQGKKGARGNTFNRMYFAANLVQTYSQ